MMIKKKAEVPLPTETKEGEIGSKENPCSGGGSTNGWKVEARVFRVSPVRPKTYLRPIHGQVLLTTEWQTIEFFEGNNPAGVPAASGIGKAHLNEHGIMDRSAAIALAYTFIAQNDESFFPELEVRIVPYSLSYTTKHWKEGEPILLEQHLDFHSKNHRDVVHKGMPDMRNNPSRDSVKKEQGQ